MIESQCCGTLKRANVYFDPKDLLKERRKNLIRQKVLEQKRMYDTMSSSRPHNEFFQSLDAETKKLVQAQRRIDVLYLCKEHQWSMRQVSRFLDFHFTSIRNIIKNYQLNMQESLTIDQEPLEV